MLFNDNDADPHRIEWLYGFKGEQGLRFARPLPLAEIYAAAQEGRIEAGLDLAMDGIDRLLTNGELKKLNLLLRDIDVQRLGGTIAVGVLTLTVAVKHQLRCRRDFLTRTARQLLAEGDSGRDIRAILKGLA